MTYSTRYGKSTGDATFVTPLTLESFAARAAKQPRAAAAPAGSSSAGSAGSANRASYPQMGEDGRSSSKMPSNNAPAKPDEEMLDEIHVSPARWTRNQQQQTNDSTSSNNDGRAGSSSRATDGALTKQNNGRRSPPETRATRRPHFAAERRYRRNLIARFDELRQCLRDNGLLDESNEPSAVRSVKVQVLSAAVDVIGDLRSQDQKLANIISTLEERLDRATRALDDCPTDDSFSDAGGEVLDMDFDLLHDFEDDDAASDFSLSSN